MTLDTAIVPDQQRDLPVCGINWGGASQGLGE